MEKKTFNSLQEVADAYNATDNTMALEAAIMASGYISDMHTEFGVCHDAKEKVIINDNGDAVVVPQIV